MRELRFEGSLEISFRVSSSNIPFDEMQLFLSVRIVLYDYFDTFVVHPYNFDFDFLVRNMWIAGWIAGYSNFDRNFPGDFYFP